MVFIFSFLGMNRELLLSLFYIFNQIQTFLILI